MQVYRQLQIIESARVLAIASYLIKACNSGLQVSAVHAARVSQTVIVAIYVKIGIKIIVIHNLLAC